MNSILKKNQQSPSMSQFNLNGGNIGQNQIKNKNMDPLVKM